MEEQKDSNKPAVSASRIGGAAKALWEKIHPDRSPETAIAEIDRSMAANEERRQTVGAELEKVYGEIAAKKKIYQSAPPARQRALKAELQLLLGRYKAMEAEFAQLCENAQALEKVKGRYQEVIAHGLRGRLTEKSIDRLADTVEDKTEEAEGILDAIEDLDAAGARSERAGDVSFEEELAGFDTESSAPAPVVFADPSAATAVAAPVGAAVERGKVENII